jgi:capsule polysaccharide export protein KpsE/RkpR
MIISDNLGSREDVDIESSLLPAQSDQPGQHDFILPLLKFIWEHRKALSKAALCGFIISAVTAFLIPVRFRSVTQLMPPDSHTGGSLGLLAAASGAGGMGALGGLAGDLLGLKSSGELFVGILSSQTAQDALIQQFQLQKIYHTSRIEDARRALADHTEIAVDRKSGIISIAVTDHDPKRAAGIAQAYVNELDRLVAQLSTSEARRERIFLEGQLQNVKADLDTAEKNFSEFASKNTAIDIPAQGKAMVQAAASLQGELIAAQAELSGLQQIYSSNNARVRSAQARVNELRKKLNEIGGQGDPGDSSMYPSLKKLPLLGLTYADLYRQTKIEETVYELLTQQYEMAKVEEAKEIPSVKVLDPALVPTKKTFPPRTLIAAIGTVLGFMFAMAWISGRRYWLLVDHRDPRPRFAVEVCSSLAGYLPRLSRYGTRAWRANDREPSSYNLSSNGSGNVDDQSSR